MKLLKIGSLLALVSLAAPAAFAFDQEITVPDAGATLAFLTASVCALGFARRFLGRNK